MGNKAVHVMISGRVQGVFFRMETLKVAQRCIVSGWVRNLPDGRVEAVFEGPPEKVDQIIDWCKKGPPMAAVADVTIEEMADVPGFTEFGILR
jgi:acylphosphatase